MAVTPYRRTLEFGGNPSWNQVPSPASSRNVGGSIVADVIEICLRLRSIIDSPQGSSKPGKRRLGGASYLGPRSSANPIPELSGESKEGIGNLTGIALRDFGCNQKSNRRALDIRKVRRRGTRFTTNPVVNRHFESKNRGE